MRGTTRRDTGSRHQHRHRRHRHRHRHRHCRHCRHCHRHIMTRLCHIMTRLYDYTRSDYDQIIPGRLTTFLPTVSFSLTTLVMFPRLIFCHHDHHEYDDQYHHQYHENHDIFNDHKLMIKITKITTTPMSRRWTIIMIMIIIIIIIIMIIMTMIRRWTTTSPPPYLQQAGTHCLFRQGGFISSS